MGRHTFLTVLIVTLIALVIGIFLPSTRHQAPTSKDFPWNVTVDDEGYSHVFGIAIGKSTIGDVINKFQEMSETSMFAAPDGKLSVEVYFDHVNLGELNARMVLDVGLDQATLKGMFERGLRISSLSGGVRKVELDPDDMVKVNNAPVASLTYLPSIKLNDDIVTRRFGKPAKRLKEQKSGLVHWLYPSIGLDLTMSDKGKDVLLYVKPSEFEQVIAPLHDKTVELPAT